MRRGGEESNFVCLSRWVGEAAFEVKFTCRFSFTLESDGSANMRSVLFSSTRFLRIFPLISADFCNLSGSIHGWIFCSL
jgi:hypothetical protein